MDDRDEVEEGQYGSFLGQGLGMGGDEIGRCMDTRGLANGLLRVGSAPGASK
jgi:hypothetical protein